MNIILETERLIIREMLESDAQSIFELDTNIDVQRYTGDIVPQSVEEAQNRIVNQIENNYLKYGYGRWAVIYKPENKFIGWSGLKYLPEFDIVDLGYRFLPEYWGLGIATEAAIPIIKYAFDVLVLDQIAGIAMTENPASINVLKKVGMTFDKLAPYDEGGVLVEWYSIDRASFKL